jgi:hypothetical protein
MKKNKYQGSSFDKWIKEENLIIKPIKLLRDKNSKVILDNALKKTDQLPDHWFGKDE